MESRLLFKVNDVIIEKYTWDLVDVNSYLISVEDKAVLIDVVESDCLLEAVKNIKDLTVILTHCHYDHIYGLNKLREVKPDVKVCATDTCSDYIDDPTRNLSSISKVYMTFYLKQDIDSMPDCEIKRRINAVNMFSCAPCDITFEDEMTLDLNGHSIRLIRFFGHSNDSLVAILDGTIMFSGDVILGIPTITRMPKGSTRKFWNEDIPRLMEMTDTIELVYPGHGKPGKLIDMINGNERPEKYK